MRHHASPYEMPMSQCQGTSKDLVSSNASSTACRRGQSLAWKGPWGPWLHRMRCTGEKICPKCLFVGRMHGHQPWPLAFWKLIAKAEGCWGKPGLYICNFICRNIGWCLPSSPSFLDLKNSWMIDPDYPDFQYFLPGLLRGFADFQYESYIQYEI